MRDSLKALRLVLYVLIVILLNLVSTELFTRTDLTRNKIYSLSDISKDAVATLREPLTIRAFFSENLPSPYNNIPQQLRDLLAEYALHSNGLFSYTFETLEGEEAEQTSESAQQYGIYPVQIESVEEDEFTAVSAYMGLAMLHGDLVETIPALTSTSRMELMLTKTILSLGNRVSALLNLEEDIRVKVILSSNLEAQSPAFEDLPQRIEAVVSDLSSEYYDRLAFERLDPTRDDAAREEALTYGIAPFEIAGAEGNEAFAAVMVTDGTEAYGGRLLIRGAFGFQIADLRTIRNTVENGVRSLLGLHEEIGYLADFDTPPYRGLSQPGAVVEPELSRFYEVVSPDYRFRGLRLSENEVPETLESLLVVQPKEPLSDWALFQIDQHLMRGGSLILFVDPYHITIPRGPGGEPMGTASYSLPDDRLRNMIESYGISLPNAYVLDERSFVQRQRTPNGVVEQDVYFAPVIDESTINTDLPFLRRLDEIITLNVGPVERAEDAPENVTFHEVFSSSEGAWLIENDPNLDPPTAGRPPPQSARTQSTLAMIAEGEFESYFADREIPSRPIDDDDEQDDGDEEIALELQAGAQRIVERGRGKIFVAASSAILGANLLGPDDNSSNVVFLQNIIDYMNGREEMAVMRSRGQRIAGIEEADAATRNFTKTFNIGGLPVLVVIAGGLVWFLRSRRRKRIRRTFESDRGQNR